jgi:Tol biopolymer transport system component
VTRWRSIVLGAATASSWWLATASETITVAQGDRLRSARAQRSADVSADGRSVAFESLARLVPADTDDRMDIYVLDRRSSRVTLESATPGAGSEHTSPRISGDGRYVVFESRADPGHTAISRTDVVLHDRVAGASRVLASAPAEPFAFSRSPDISDDGRVVAFSSTATTLTAGPDANGALEDVYLVRLPDGAVSRVSVTSAGVQSGRGNSILPSLSADGRWLAFASTAPLDEPASGAKPGRDRVRQIYVRDAIGGRTTRVTRPPNRGVPNGDSSLPSISADGRRVAFVSEASNLLDGDSNRASDILLYDRETETLTWVSRGADGSSAGGESTGSVISGDGRFVVFQSDASNLVCTGRGSCGPRATAGGEPRAAGNDHAEDINLLWDVFVFDSTVGTIVRLSEDELGTWMEPSAGPAIDGRGQVIAFSSRHPVDASDRGDDFDLFVRAVTVPPATTRKHP